MVQSYNLIDLAGECREWTVSFDGEFYEGLRMRCTWPQELPLDRSVRFVLAQEISSSVPLLKGTIDYLVAFPLERTALTRGIAIVHPALAEDCFEEVLYGLFLHLDLLPSGVKAHIDIPPTFAPHVTTPLLQLVAKKNKNEHPPSYRVNPEFSYWPHPLSVTPDEEAEETIMCSRLIPERTVFH